MNDNEIVQMYWDRNDKAIEITSEKYGRYCKSIAKNILYDEGDADECVNDTYLNVWNCIPTHRPERLSTFLGKITRNLAFNKYKSNNAKKRGGGEFVLILDELSECISDNSSLEQMIDRKGIINAVNLFLKGISKEKRDIFVRRYWYADKVSEIAKNYGMRQSSVSKTLERTRKQLKAYLLERGFKI